MHKHFQSNVTAVDKVQHEKCVHMNNFYTDFYSNADMLSSMKQNIYLSFMYIMLTRSELQFIQTLIYEKNIHTGNQCVFFCLLVYLLWKHFISFVLKVMPQIGPNLPLPYTYRYQWVDLIKQYQICTIDCGIKSLNSFSVQYMLVSFSKFHAFLKTWEKPLALLQDQEMQQQFWPK